MRQALEQSQIDRGTVGHRGQPIKVSSESMLSMPLASDTGGGTLTTALPQGGWAQFMMSGKDSAGDGTVPISSGQAPARAGVKASYHINVDAEGHEGAYRVEQAQRLTLHSILQISNRVPVNEL
jgi:hypothetical protein